MAEKVDPRARLASKFRMVARDRVALVTAQFSVLERGRVEPEAVDALMREIHTLKGESRLMGFLHVNEIAHRSEDLLGWARERNFKVPAAAADLVYEGLDLIGAHVAEDADEAQLEGRRTDYLRRVSRFLAGAGPGEGDGESTAPSLPASASEPEGSNGGSIGHGLGDFMRVPTAALISLTELTGQLVVHEDETSRLVQDLWELLRERSGPDAEPLIDLIRRLREEVFEARLRSSELQDTVRHLRLLSISSLFERYPPAIRDLARERGKRVRVAVEGGEVAVDKQVLDLIDEAILHLVRNAIDHGIELPPDRIAAGKPERGTISLIARQLGSRVEIAVRDDGRGVSPADLRRAAVARGLMDESTANLLDDDDALRLVFRPGFSTSTSVTDVSGRGVGLDVVSDKVRSLGGAVELATTHGRGAVFTLTLPISIALMRMLCFHCGRVIFGLPSTSVYCVLRTPPGAAERAGDGFAVELEGGHVPLVDLRRALGARTDGAEELEIVVLEHGTTRIGLVVDGFLGERQVVQRSLGAFLGGLRLLSGTGLLERGQVVLLLSVPEIVQRWGEGESPVQALPLEARAAPEWRVLVVDDSELTRDMLVSMARRTRLRVVEAVNGREALSKMAGSPPDLILTDLDMPVMDGFELISRVRADPGLRETPVVVLTTRGSDDDKRRAMAVGADAFLVKSEFNEEALSATIGRFLEAHGVSGADRPGGRARR
jgi:two-component system, chemotaxis family, sensor kinase CheA